MHLENVGISLVVYGKNNNNPCWFFDCRDSSSNNISVLVF
jgi:hypothetical protein